MPSHPTRRTAWFVAFLHKYPWLVIGIVAMFTFSRMALLEGWDNAFYFGQLTSVAQDGDLRLHDDLLDYPNSAFDRLHSATIILGNGIIHNTFSIGPAVLHSLYTWPLLREEDAVPWSSFRAAITIGSLLMVVVMAIATSRAAQLCGIRSNQAALGTGLAFLGGPLAIYGTCVYINSHLGSAMAAALLLVATLIWRQGGGYRAAVFAGLAAGLLVLHRWQDIVLAGGALAMAVCARRDDTGYRTLLVQSMAAVATLVLTLSVQLLVWHVYYGSWFLIPQGSHFMKWDGASTASFLFSGYHGVLPWAPAFALGFVGLVLLLRGSTRTIACFLLMSSAVSIYVSSAALDWWAGSSYGPRRLSALTPVAAIGLGAILQRLSSKGRVMLVAASVGWAVFSTSAWLAGWDDLNAVFYSRASPDNPYGYGPYEQVRWRDGWGALYFLKPGFTFSDGPGNRDRLVGLVSVALIVCLGRLAWLLVARSPRLQTSVLIAAGLWIGCWIFTLSRMEPNGLYDDKWRSVVREAVAVPPGLPAGMKDAATVVVATRLAARGRETEFGLLMNAVDQSKQVRVTRESIMSLVRGPLPPTFVP